MSLDQAFNARSPLWPKGGCPRSWARQAVSTTSGSRPRLVASFRPTCATSRECVSRFRAKSRPWVGLSTCVLAASLRSALECSSRARSRAKSLRREECSSGRKRAVSCGPYAPSATGGVRFSLGQLPAVRVADLPAVEPALRKSRTLRAARSATRTLGALPRVRHLPVESSQQVIQLLQRLHRGQACAKVAAHRIPLEVPGNMLADVAARTLFAVEELDEEFGVTADGRSDRAQGRPGHPVLATESSRQVTEEPRSPEASATHYDAIATGLFDHADGIRSRPDVAVAENRNSGDGLLELGDRRPVGLAAVEL